MLVPPIKGSSSFAPGQTPSGDKFANGGTFESTTDSTTNSNTQTSASSSILAATSLLIGAQFFGKLVTFSLNQALLRFVNPNIVGLNSQFELLTNTVLFFSREAIRLATQRQTLQNKRPDIYVVDGGVVYGTVSGTIQLVVNVGFIPLILGVILSTVIGSLYYLFSSQLTSTDAVTGIIIYCSASVIELAGEPCFLLNQLELNFRSRAITESTAVLGRCIVTFACIVFSHQNPIIAYSLGQLSYACITSILYIFSAFGSHRRERYKVYGIQGVTPVSDREESQIGKIYIDGATKQLATSIYLQTIFKHCLSEGDKFLVSLLLPLADQGVYSLVVNYGSLIARLGFLPIEEALRNYFSKLLNATSKEKHDASSNWKDVSPVLTLILRGYVYLSILAVIFGPLASDYALSFLVSSSWRSGTNASDVLAAYACYIPFMAMNGALEAFVQSVATISDIKRQSAAMLAFSAAFGIAACIFMSDKLLSLGAMGLVFANMLNMSLRIGWCVMFIDGYYHSQTDNTNAPVLGWLRPALPSRTVVSTAVISASVAWYYMGPAKSFMDMARLCIAAGVLLAVIAYDEKEIAAGFISRIRKNKRVPPSAQKS